MNNICISKKIKNIFKIFFLIIICLNMFNINTTYAKTNEVDVIYFKVPLCNNCNKFEERLDNLQEEYKNINVYSYDISKNENFELLLKYNNEYNLNEKSSEVPIIFVSNQYIKDESNIRPVIEKILDNDNIESTPILDEAKLEKKVSLYNIFGFILTGFINGLNPCSISMLLFFISLISVKNIGIKKLGFSFILGKFIAYLLIGSLLYSSISKVSLNSYNNVIKILVILFSAIIIYLNLNDFFKARKEKFGEIKNQLPKNVRRLNHNIIKNFLENKNGKILIIISFVLGVVISLGEFLCTGQIYLASISYMMKQSSAYSLQAFLYLFLYDLTFIIPPIIIVLILDKGTDMFKVSTFFVDKIYLIKLFNAILIFLFCLFVVFTL